MLYSGLDVCAAVALKRCLGHGKPVISQEDRSHPCYDDQSSKNAPVTGMAGDGGVQSWQKIGFSQVRVYLFHIPTWSTAIYSTAIYCTASTNPRHNIILRDSELKCTNRRPFSQPVTQLREKREKIHWTRQSCTIVTMQKYVDYVSAFESPTWLPTRLQSTDKQAPQPLAGRFATRGLVEGIAAWYAPEAFWVVLSNA